LGQPKRSPLATLAQAALPSLLALPLLMGLMAPTAAIHHSARWQSGLAVSAVNTLTLQASSKQLAALLSGAGEGSRCLVLAEPQAELAILQAAVLISLIATLLHTASLCIQDAERSSTMARSALRTELLAAALEARALAA
jgi:hypothetical protein